MQHPEEQRSAGGVQAQVVLAMLCNRKIPRVVTIKSLMCICSFSRSTAREVPTPQAPTLGYLKDPNEFRMMHLHHAMRDESPRQLVSRDQTSVWALGHRRGRQALPAGARPSFPLRLRADSARSCEIRQAVPLRR